MSDKQSETKEQRSIDEVQADIDQTRRRLTDNISQLKEETKPKALVARGKAGVTSVFVDPETGAVRTERVVAAASVVVGLLVVRRGLKSRARKRELRKLGEVVWVPVPRNSVNPQLIPLARDAAELGPEPVPALTAA